MELPAAALGRPRRPALVWIAACLAIGTVAQYIAREEVAYTPHLIARIPALPDRIFGSEMVSRITAIYEVDTTDWVEMMKVIRKQLSVALESLPQQYLEMESYDFMTAGGRCTPRTLRCYKMNPETWQREGEGMLSPGVGGALPYAYNGSLEDMDPRTCEPASGSALTSNPLDMMTQDGMATGFHVDWDEDPGELDRLIYEKQFCVNKGNTSLMFYPIAVENIFVTGWRDQSNRILDKRLSEDIKLELHVVGVIPTLWARYFNRKFVFNGTSIPLPMFQPEVVDDSRVYTNDLNVSMEIIAIRKMIRPPEIGDLYEYNMPVCVDPPIRAAGCVKIVQNFYSNPFMGEYKLRSYVEWRKQNFTRWASEQPHPSGTFNVSEGPWPVVSWVGFKEETGTNAAWVQRRFPQKEYIYQQDCVVGNECHKVPHAPSVRHLHSAILYTTWSFKDQAQRYLCDENPACREDCLANLTCLGGANYFNANFFFRSSLFKDDDGGVTPKLTLEDEGCPRGCCVDRRLCMRKYDVTGHEVPYDSEMMLVFGGKSYVHTKDPVTGKLIYHDCERIPSNRLRKEWRSCMEQVLGDLWRYDIARGKWDYIKPDSIISPTTQKPIGYPLPRYGHGAALVTEVYGRDVNFKRLFMYIYGGMSPQCSAGGVCADVWKYEIPWAPQAYYPKFPDGDWQRANEWTKLKDCPFGGAYRHAMVVTSGSQYIYTYGGQAIGGFTNRLLRYRIATDMWEDLDPFGRTSLTRLMYDFRGNQVIKKVPVREYDRTVDVDCANAWRYDGPFQHCRQCPTCRLETGTRDDGTDLPEERGDTMLTNFADLTPGAVDDLLVMFGGYRTTWGTLRDTVGECRAAITTTSTLKPEFDWSEDVVLTDAPSTTEWVVTTTTIPRRSGIEFIGDFEVISENKMTTTVTTRLWTTTATTTEVLLQETQTSTTSTSVSTQTSTTSSTETETTSTSGTSTYTGTTIEVLTTSEIPITTLPPVTAGIVLNRITNFSGLEGSSGDDEEDELKRVGPEECTSRYYFNDLWLYEAATNQFFRHDTEGDLPTARKGHRIIVTRPRSDDPQMLLFGGHNQDTPFNDMWVLQVQAKPMERRWARIDPYFPGDLPPPMSYHTFLYSERLSIGIVFGGVSWKKTDLERSDFLRNVDRRCVKHAQDMVEEDDGKTESAFLRSMRRYCEDVSFCCELANEARPPTYWHGNRIRTSTGALNLSAVSGWCRADCQERAFYPEFYPIMSEGVWVFRTDRCPNECSGHGVCDMSQCICEPPYYGVDCSQVRCPGSPCYTDSRTKEHFCTDCSGHGRCIAGRCQCYPGWGFDDCSAILCEDNCSSTPYETRGICVPDFPVHECSCVGAWSGRKCDKRLCLNTCTHHGACQDGTCVCEAGWHGDDCSLWTLSIK